MIYPNLNQGESQDFTIDWKSRDHHERLQLPHKLAKFALRDRLLRMLIFLYKVRVEFSMKKG